MPRPAIAAIAVTAWTLGRPGLRDLLARIARWQVPLRWWLVAVSPAVFLGLGLAALAVTGRPLPKMAEFGQFSGTPAIGLAGVLVIILVGAVGEETGWRGYALVAVWHGLYNLVSGTARCPASGSSVLVLRLRHAAGREAGGQPGSPLPRPGGLLRFETVLLGYQETLWRCDHIETVRAQQPGDGL